MTVVRLGAHCELESESPRQANFRVSEYAVLDDGTEIPLHAERGLSVSTSSPVGIWAHETAESLERDVRTVVLPHDAEPTGEEHHWDWLVELLATHGVVSTVEHLRSVPYDVRFGQRVLTRLRPST